MKSSILFILHLPPPVHGASTMGKYIQESQMINEEFNSTFINLATAGSIADIGKLNFNKVKIYIKLLIKVYKQIKKVRPNLVYITPNAKGKPFYKDFVVIQLIKALNCKVVVHYHNKGVCTRQNKFIDNILYKLFFKNIKVILLSETLYQDIAKYVNRSNVFICPNGIPITTKQTINKNNDKPQLLYLSNLQKEKGIIDVLDACSILKTRGYKFNCNIIGGETDEINATTLIEEIKVRNLVDNVQYLGKKFDKEKNEFYEKTDIFVFPTYYHNECFPVVLLEAMQYGCVCISTDEGGITDIIDNKKNGYIVEKKNPSMLASTIEKLINNPNLIQKMSKAGKEKFTSYFTLDKYEQNIHTILEELSKK